MIIAVEGIPEGLEVVRVGPAADNEFELTQATDGKHHITKGPRAESSTQIIVRPMPGYAFKFDIRDYCYKVAKMLPVPVEATVTFTFNVESDVDKGNFSGWMARLREDEKVSNIRVEGAPEDWKL